MEVAEGIHRIEAPLGDRINCLYLLEGDERSVLVDSGTSEVPESVLLPYLQESGIDPDQVEFAVITHSDVDHMGGNAGLKELLPQVRLMCHELDRAMVEDVELLISDRYGEWRHQDGITDAPELKDAYRAMASAASVDVTVAGGESLRLGSDWWVKILHTPGHSPGSISLYDPRSKAAIIGDAVLYDAVLSADGEPALPPTYRNVAPYLQTIELFGKLEIEHLLSSHYPVYTGEDVKSFLARSREFVEKAETEVLNELGAGDRTLLELIPAVGPRLGSWGEQSHGFLVFALTGHLERLQEENRVETDDGNPRRFSLVG